MSTNKNQIKSGRPKSPAPANRLGTASEPSAAGSVHFATPDNPLVSNAVYELRHTLTQRNSGLFYLPGLGDHHQQQQQQHYQLQQQLQSNDTADAADDDVVVGISDLRHESLNQILRQSIEIEHQHHKPAGGSAVAVDYRDNSDIGPTTTDDDANNNCHNNNNNNNNNDNNNSERNDCDAGNHNNDELEDDAFVVRRAAVSVRCAQHILFLRECWVCCADFFRLQ